VTLAALGTFFAATAGDHEPRGHYVVAARSVDQGERLDDGDVRVVAMDLPASVAEHAFRDVTALRGAVALAPLREGSLIEASQVLPPNVATDEPLPPTHELSLRLPVEQAVDAALNRGERVDVLATYGTGDEATTVVVTRDALVTAIGHPDDAGLGDEGGLTLTLAVVDDETVLRLTHAKDVGTITLVRATRDEGVPSGPDRYDGPAVAPEPPTTGEAPA
jgi:Flp pilus assembly protein CpaB